MLNIKLKHEKDTAFPFVKILCHLNSFCVTEQQCWNLSHTAFNNSTNQKQQSLIQKSFSLLPGRRRVKIFSGTSHLLITWFHFWHLHTKTFFTLKEKSTIPPNTVFCTLNRCKYFSVLKVYLCAYLVFYASCPSSCGCQVVSQHLQFLDQQWQLCGCGLFLSYCFGQHPQCTALLDWRSNRHEGI